MFQAVFKLRSMRRDSEIRMDFSPADGCELHAHPDAQVCNDWGIAAWWIDEGGRIQHEDFYLHDALWESSSDDEAVERIENGVEYRVGSFVLCMGVLRGPAGPSTDEGGLQVRATKDVGRPPSYRFRRRWKATREFGAGERT